MLRRLVTTVLLRRHASSLPFHPPATQHRGFAIKVEQLFKQEVAKPAKESSFEFDVVEARRVTGKEDVLESKETSTARNSEFKTLIQLGESGDRSVLKTPEFRELSSKIDQNCHKANAATLHQCILATVALGLPADNRLVACLENELLWVLRKCNFRFLVQVAPTFGTLQRSDLEKRLHAEISASLQRRWVEVSSLKDVLKLVSTGTVHRYGQEFTARLDDRAVELAAGAPPGDLQKMLCALAKVKRRPGPLLRALSYHLARQEMSLTPRQLADLLSALHTLSFPDQPLLDRISTDLKIKLPEVKSLAVIRSLIVTVGLLKWRNTGFIDSVCDWLVTNKSTLKPLEKLSVLHTLAVINYFPSGVEEILGSLESKEVVDSMTTGEFLTYVWASVLLQRASSEMISKLFSRLGSSPVSSSGDLLRLQNVVQFSKLTKLPVPSSVEKLSSEATAYKSTDSESLSSAVLQALTHLVPKPKYLKEPSKTPAGIRLDAEFLVNEEFEPVPLEKAKAPGNFRRVALFCWSYNDYCIGSDQLSGYSAFIRRCCKQGGYTVLDVSHNEFDRKEKTVVKVQYLQKKLKALKSGANAIGPS